MYSSCSFWYVFILWAFLSLCVLAFVGFLLYSKNAIFMLYHFSLIAIASHGTLHLALSIVEMHSAAAATWAVTKFSYSSFGVCLWDTSWKVSNYFLTVSIYWFLISLLVTEEQSYYEALTVCVLFLRGFKRIFDEKILWFEGTLSKKEYTSQFTALHIHFLFMNI